MNIVSQNIEFQTWFPKNRVINIIIALFSNILWTQHKHAQVSMTLVIHRCKFSHKAIGNFDGNIRIPTFELKVRFVLWNTSEVETSAQCNKS